MKILFILLGIDFSGAEKVLVDYLSGNDRIQPEFLTIFPGAVVDRLKKIFPESRVGCLKTKYSRNQLRLFPQTVARSVAIRLQAYIESNDVQILYANNTLEAALCGYFAKSATIPCVAHIHDMKQSFGSFPKRKLLYTYAKFYSRVFTVSEACRRSWALRNMQVIYNGISERFWTIRERQRQRQTGHQFTVGLVGTISKRKGAAHLLDAIEYLGPKTQWKIAYGNVEADCQPIMIQLRQLDNVDLYEDIDEDQLIRMYDKLDVLLMLSIYDPLPTVVIEAMSRRRAVVAFNSSGFPEMIPIPSLLVRKGDYSGLCDRARAISLLSASDYDEMSSELYHFAKEHFSQNNKRKLINAELETLIG